jgi:hypothetical protein
VLFNDKQNKTDLMCFLGLSMVQMFIFDIKHLFSRSLTHRMSSTPSQGLSIRCNGNLNQPYNTYHFVNDYDQFCS